MIRIQHITLAFDHEPVTLQRAVLEKLNVPEKELLDFRIVRKSIDARKKNRILAVYSVDAQVKYEPRVLSRHATDRDIAPSPDLRYRSPIPVHLKGAPPVVVGTGPCGLFAGLILAEAGLRPILVERGKAVQSRVRDVNRFWTKGLFNPESNVPFGEGGAGTFSDGKLTTQIRDGKNRIRKVLLELVKAGAPEEILYAAKPHLGTDNLIRVVRNLRKTILNLGGEVRFETKLTDIRVKGGSVYEVIFNDSEAAHADTLVLALGHSARDTFQMLHEQKIPMTPKAFSIGIRIEHPQALIDQAQYGPFASHPRLGPSDYRLVYHCPNGRTAYTFCMCPGGRVIGASSEPGGIVINGMSLYARNSPNANSALLVGVNPADFGLNSPLSGIFFQRKWEQKAFKMGGGNYFAPIQRVEDFLSGKPSVAVGQVTPSYAPGTTPGDLTGCLPDFVVDTLRLAIPELNRKLKGFAMADAVMTAVETRSSSPVRILRDKTFQSPGVAGLYPAGEGAGYAGGIISSAVDGIRVAEAIIAGRSSLPENQRLQPCGSSGHDPTLSRRHPNDS